MSIPSADAIVAGHTCLDIIPDFDATSGSLDTLLQPGRLTEVGGAVTAPGGAVSNVGVALHRLGLTPRLVGKVGDDLFGRATLDLLRQHEEGLVDGMIVADGASSSYTIVVRPPGVERSFFHCPGPNETFRPDEVSLDRRMEARLFHFGYPPLLRQVYLDGGTGLAALFEDAQAQGMAVSLDMTVPDPDAESGRVDWAAWLTTVLPQVDLFAPSLAEILFMLDYPQDERLQGGAGADALPARSGTGLLDRVAHSLIERRVPLVVLTLGDQGLYLRTAADPDLFQGLEAALGLDPQHWTDRQLLLPPFEAEIAGTTGAGDAAVAGLMVGLHHGLSPEATLRRAVAVGTFTVEAPDGTSGLPDWAAVQARLRSGWTAQPLEMAHPGWTWSARRNVWVGPDDGG